MHNATHDMVTALIENIFYGVAIIFFISSCIQMF